MPITDIYSQPTEVEIGGLKFRIDEIRIADIIDLQSWLDRNSESPIDKIRDELDSMEQDSRESALLDALAISDDWQPEWGKDSGRAIWQTEGGILETFRVILRWHHPELMDDDIKEIAYAANDSKDGWGQILRAWRKITATEEIESLLGITQDEEGEEIGWAQSIVEVIAMTGWTYDYIKMLPLSQFNAIRSGGKKKEAGIQVMPGQDVGSVWQSVMQRFKRAIGG